MLQFFELIKYSFFGVITTIINFILFYLMVSYGIHYLFANIFSYFFAVLLSYFFNNKYVFNEVKVNKSIKRILSFILIRLGAIGFDTILLEIFVSILESNVYISKVIVSSFVIFMTYILNKRIVFK